MHFPFYLHVEQRHAGFSFIILHSIIFVFNNQKLTVPFTDFQKGINE